MSAIAADVLVPFNSLVQPLPADYKVFDPYGRLFGWCRDIHRLNEVFLEARRSLSIDPFVGRDQDDLLLEWRLQADIGRMVRPLVVVSNLHKIPQLVANAARGASILPLLLSNGCLEYVSPSEELSLKVTYILSEDTPFTHLEVTDVAFVGIIAALSPFFRHNQGPRLVYWIGMSKQTIGTTTAQDMGAATTHNLWYGQKPMVVTRTARDMNMDQIPDCVNVTIIFFPHSYNQEDAIVMNRASIDRGLFVSHSVRTYTAETRATVQDPAGERFERPTREQTFCMKDADYSKLEANGLPKLRQAVKGRDVIIGKTIPNKKISSSAVVNAPGSLRGGDKQKIRRDQSVQVRDDEYGTVGSVVLANKPDGDIVKVGVRTVRTPIVGDKFSSRHAQKVPSTISPRVVSTRSFRVRSVASLHRKTCPFRR